MYEYPSRLQLASPRSRCSKQHPRAVTPTPTVTTSPCQPQSGPLPVTQLCDRQRHHPVLRLACGLHAKGVVPQRIRRRTSILVTSPQHISAPTVFAPRFQSGSKVAPMSVSYLCRRSVTYADKKKHQQCDICSMYVHRRDGA